MSRFTLCPGVRIRIGEINYSMRQKLEGDRWRLEKEADGEIVILSEHDLLEQYNQNIIKFVNDNRVELGFVDVKSRISRIFHDYPQTLQDEAKRRLAFVRSIEGVKRCDAQTNIQKVSEQLQVDAPCPHSVYRWHKIFQASNKNICSLLPNFSARGNRKPRYVQDVMDIAVRVINKEYLTLNKPPLTETTSAVQNAVEQENIRRNDENKLPIPERKFVRNIIAAMDKYEVDRARMGKAAADKKYREVNTTGERITEPLQRVEIDHTSLDLIVVADETYLPIGRPTLTVAFDRCTRCVLGYHVGYDPPSYVSVAYCLSHAVKKKDVKSTYPSIQNDWLCWGLPQQLVVDNGLEFHSTDLETAAMSLLIDIRYCPVRQPWWKGGVERFFRTLNTGLIHLVPGTTFSNIFAKGDYVSAKYAVLTVSELNELLHMWICDVYHQQQNRQSLRAPASLWRERIVAVQQTLPESSELLEISLASSEHKSLFHYGITLNNLTYNSHELQQLRRRFGKKLVPVRWDRTDLGYIHVLDEHENKYMKIPCTWSEYAEGLSLWLHQRIREEALAQDGGTDVRDKLNQAKARIREKIEKAMSSKKLGTRKIAARGKLSFPDEPSPVKMKIKSSGDKKVNEDGRLIKNQPIDVAKIPEYEIEDRNKRR